MKDASSDMGFERGAACCGAGAGRLFRRQEGRGSSSEGFGQASGEAGKLHQYGDDDSPYRFGASGVPGGGVVPEAVVLPDFALQ